MDTQRSNAPATLASSTSLPRQFLKTALRASTTRKRPSDYQLRAFTHKAG
jgi:hypothetical protein